MYMAYTNTTANMALCLKDDKQMGKKIDDKVLLCTRPHWQIRFSIFTYEINTIWMKSLPFGLRGLYKRI